MFCHKCGKEIDDEAVVCVHCGVSTIKMEKKNAPISIVNQSSSSATAKAPRTPNVALDIFMIFLTGGFWIFWMIIRSFIR